MCAHKIRECEENEHWHESLIKSDKISSESSGSSTLPRPPKATDADLTRNEKPATNASSTSLYDNVTSSNQAQGESKFANQHRLSIVCTFIFN